MSIKGVCYYLLGDLVIIVGVWCVCFLFYPLVFCRLLGNILSVYVVLFKSISRTGNNDSMIQQQAYIRFIMAENGG